MKKEYTQPQYYTGRQILYQYNSISNKKKVEVLWEAISAMQSNNNQSQTDCLARALGFTPVDYDKYERR